MCRVHQWQTFGMGFFGEISIVNKEKHRSGRKHKNNQAKQWNFKKEIIFIPFKVDQFVR